MDFIELHNLLLINTVDVYTAYRAFLFEDKRAEHTNMDELLKAVEAAPDDHQKRLDLATALQAEGRSAEAIDCLIESIKRAPKWNDDAARKQLLTIFEALGFMHELSVEGRRKLSALLFR